MKKTWILLAMIGLLAGPLARAADRILKCPEKKPCDSTQCEYNDPDGGTTRGLCTSECGCV